MKVAFGYKKKIIRPEGPAKKNNLAPILSEKNILARTKNPSPPLNIKWTVPYGRISEAKLAIHHIVMDVKICEKCRILRVCLQKASDIQYESTKPASERTNISLFKRNIKRDSSHLLQKSSM